MDAAKLAFERAKANLEKAMVDGASAKTRAEEAEKILDDGMKAGIEVQMAIAKLDQDRIDGIKKTAEEIKAEA